MKMITEHLGEIIIALVIFALLCTLALGLRGPMDDFFNNVANRIETTEPEDDTIPDPGGTTPTTPSVITYEVKYDANKGSGTMANSSHTYGVAKALSPNQFTRTGYSFFGWATSASGARKYIDKEYVKNLTTVSGSTVNLFAVWQPNTYRVEFHPNGGSGTMDTISFTYDVAGTLPANRYIRDDYQFVSWNTAADGSGVTYTDCAEINFGTIENLPTSGTITLYAQWQAAVTTANYRVNHWQQTLTGGSDKNDTNFDIADSQIFSARFNTDVTPAVKNYPGFKSPSVQKVTVAENGSTVVDYYYTRNVYIVTLNKGGAGVQSVFGAGSYRYGQTITTGASMAPGYEWSRWSGTRGSTDLANTFEIPATNVTNTAIAVPISYPISYNLNNGVVSPSNPLSYNIETETFTLNNPTKTGYSFTGWVGSNGSTPQKSVSVEKGNMGARTYNAVWKPNTYTVTYNANGGSGEAMGNSSFTYDVEGKLSANTYSRHGYVFKGWSTSENGSAVYVDQATVKNLTTVNGATVNLYAVWQVIDYSITYNLDGGQLPSGVSNPTSYNVEDGDITLHNPVKEDYTFIGWTGSNSVSSPEITVTIPAGSTGAKTYTANWEYGDVVAQALYSEDDESLTFVRAPLYRAGDTFTDRDNNKKVLTAVYTGFESFKYTSDTVPWISHAEDVVSVVVEDEMIPVSTSFWFMDFTNCSSLDLTNLNTSSVTTMNSTFMNTGYNVESFVIDGLDGWDTSKVAAMVALFNATGHDAKSFDIGDLSNWDTSRVKTMNSTFKEAGFSAETFNVGNIGNWDTSNVTMMYCMFTQAGTKAKTFNIGNLSNWDTSNVTSMASMFQMAGRAAETFDIGNLNTKTVTNTDGTSYTAWNTSKVKNMYAMFHWAGNKATSFNIGSLSEWDTSNVTNMIAMFYACGSNAETFDIGDLDNWNTSNVTKMTSMFASAGKKATKWNVGDLSTKIVTRADNSSYTAWDVSDVDSMCDSLEYNEETGKWNVVGMFEDAGSNTISFNVGDISTWNTSNVTVMDCMFKNTGLKDPSFTLDLSGWNVDNVISWVEFDKYVEDKVNEPIFHSSTDTLSLREEVNLPDGVITGDALTLVSMPDVDLLHSDIAVIAPEGAVLYGWQIDSGMATQTVAPSELAAVLESVYNEDPNWVMELTPLYQFS